MLSNLFNYTFLILILTFYLSQQALLSEEDSNNKTTTEIAIETTKKTTKFVTVHQDHIDNLNWSVWCKFQPNGFDCTEKNIGPPMFYYDVKMDDCKTFIYGKCPFSKNLFESITACHDACRDEGPQEMPLKVSANVYCRYQPDFGSCNNYFPMYYFDITLRQCRGFSYSGCDGNDNRFSSPQICQAICSTSVEY